MSYSEYSKLTVIDGSSAVLSDIPARPEHSEWMVRALAEGAPQVSMARSLSVLWWWMSRVSLLVRQAIPASGA